MESYITKELVGILANELDHAAPYALSGHSMGGHGALTLGMKYPDLFSSISAFAPIVAPTQVPWGQKAFQNYLGSQSKWEAHDACHLVKSKGYQSKILIDQGDADNFLENQLQPQLFQKACEEANVELELRFQKGYDHSYFFISTFIEDHFKFHLKA
jgi:S-formylglutathione hydrolase